MQVNVSARHGSLQPGDQELIVEKSEKLRRLYDRINAIEVTVDLAQSDKPVVEIKASAEQADNPIATGQATTVISAFDIAVNKVEQQLRRLKEKKKIAGHRAKGHKHMEAAPHDDEDSDQ